MANEVPDEQENGRWSFLRHPFVIAALSSITAIAVAVIALSGKSDPAPQPPGTEPAQQSQGTVAFRVEPDFESYKEGWKAVFGGPLPDTAQYPKSEGEYPAKLRWARTRGAVDIGTSHLRLYLQNTGAERVTIRGLSAKLTERLDPLAQTYLEAPSAGVNDIVQLEFDLDEGDVVAAVESGGAASGAAEPFFATRNVTLDPGETTDLRLTTKATRCLCRYRFALEIVTVDSTLTLEVGDSAGRPFSISGGANSYADRWMDGGLACGSTNLVRVDAEGSPDCASSPAA